MKSELKKSTINTILNLYNTHIQRHNHYKKYWETQDYCSTKYLTSIFSEKETGAGMVLHIKLSK